MKNKYILKRKMFLVSDYIGYLNRLCLKNKRDYYYQNTQNKICRIWRTDNKKDIICFGEDIFKGLQILEYEIIIEENHTNEK